MDLWTPPRDAPHLLEWWRPLMLVSRRARHERFPWPVHLDEFRLAGRVVRKGRPDIWIYEHHENGGSVCVDATGETYKYTETPRATSPGRFTACDVRTALWRARLPEVVAPVWYDEGRPRRDPHGGGDAMTTATGGGGEFAGEVDGEGHDHDAGGAGGRRAPGDGAAGHEPRSSSRVIRRGHLTLIAG